MNNICCTETLSIMNSSASRLKPVSSPTSMGAEVSRAAHADLSRVVTNFKDGRHWCQENTPHLTPSQSRHWVSDAADPATPG